MTKRRAPLDPTRVKPLFGAKRSLPILERSLADPDDMYEPSPRQRQLQAEAAGHTHTKRLGVDPE